MTRQTAVLGLFLLVVAVIAVVFTATRVTTPAASLIFNTPTASITPTPRIQATQQSGARITLDVLTETNCTFSTSVWLQYPDSWQLESFRIGDVIYTRSEALAFLRTQTTDVAVNLLIQLLTVVINQRYGADPTIMLSTISNAIDWLALHPPGSVVSQADQETGLALTQTLADFNNGVTGPGACQGAPFTPTPTPTSTATASATPTITLTPAVTPTRTLGPTAQPTRTPTRPPVQRPPRATVRPTNPPQPTPEPTETERPEPTSPPLPDTP
jgi:hypothetical protein